MNEQVVALLLAGGVGSRLSALCTVRAKPAIPFGGIYRIIDFTLSNLMNSDIRRVGVLTQYSPLSLTNHIRDGSSWDFSGWRREIKILPPYTGRSNSDWYRGTADAVHQNLSFLKKFSPEHILIVSGDHIYSMDYNKMIKFHIRKNAEVTIGTLPVTMDEAKRFGVMDVDGEDRITGFYEKIQNPPSTIASLGIYLFKYKTLLNYLETEYQNPKKSEHDFGKDILPAAVKSGYAFAYPFQGYWRDVGTVQAYWQSSMEFIQDNSQFFKKGYELRTNLKEYGKGDRPGAKMLYNARIKHSLISRGCVVDGIIESSILSPGVIVEKGAKILQSVIMHDSIIRNGAQLYGVICDKQVSIGQNSIIGDQGISEQQYDSLDQILYNNTQTVIGKDSVIPADICIGRNCEILAMVQEQDFTHNVIPDKKIIRSAAY